MHCLIVASSSVALDTAVNFHTARGGRIYFTFADSLAAKRDRLKVYRKMKKKFPLAQLILPEDLVHLSISWDNVITL